MYKLKKRLTKINLSKEGGNNVAIWEKLADEAYDLNLKELAEKFYEEMEK